MKIDEFNGEISSFLKESVWLSLQIDSVYAVYSNGDISIATPPRQVYEPRDRIPAFLLCRTSTSTKRLTKPLSARKANTSEMLYNCTVNEVIGGGAVIGVVVQFHGAFSSASVTPDGLYLVTKQDFEVSHVSMAYEHKTFRLYTLRSPDSKLYDLMLTAKERWYRVVYDPKILGFNKDTV